MANVGSSSSSSNNNNGSSATATATATTAVAPPGQKWRCDVCRVRFFADFNEAVAHESRCKGVEEEGPVPGSAAALSTAVAVAVPSESESMAPPSTEQPRGEEAAATASFSSSSSVRYVTQDPEPSATGTATATATATASSVPDSEEVPVKPPSPIITPTKSKSKSKPKPKRNTNMKIKTSGGKRSTACNLTRTSNCKRTRAGTKSGGTLHTLWKIDSKAEVKSKDKDKSGSNSSSTSKSDSNSQPNRSLAQEPSSEATTMALVQSIQERLSRIVVRLKDDNLNVTFNDGSGSGNGNIGVGVSVNDDENPWQDIVRELLRHLETAEVTRSILEATGIGKTLVKLVRHGRRHQQQQEQQEPGSLHHFGTADDSEEAILASARALIDQWKSCVGEDDGGGTGSGSGSDTGSSGIPVQSSTAQKQQQPQQQKQRQQQQQPPPPPKPTHSFFRPRSALPKLVPVQSSRSSSNNNNKTPAATNPFFAPRKRAPSVVAADAVLAETKSLKRRLPDNNDNSNNKSNNNDNSDSDCVVAAKRKPPPLPTTEPFPLAALLQDPSSLPKLRAEQRIAELEARMEAERNRERERRVKREAFLARAARSNNNNNNNNNKNKPSSKSSQSQLQMQIHSGGALAHSTAGVSSSRLPPLAPRFPVPNHAGIGLLTKAPAPPSVAVAVAVALPPNHPFRKRSARTSDAVQRNDNDNDNADVSSRWFSDPSDLDGCGVRATRFTAVQQALWETFSSAAAKASVPSNHNSKNDNANNSTNNSTNNNANAAAADDDDARLWSDKHGMESGIAGERPAHVFRQLVDYIDHWRVARTEALERAAERHRSLARGKPKRRRTRKTTTTGGSSRNNSNNYGYDCDDDWLAGSDDDDCGDEFDPLRTPLCLLTGPPASGKTAMVHAVAEHCGKCTVLEIHTGRARNGAALKHAIEEATRSNSSRDLLRQKQKRKQNHPGFFGTSESKSRCGRKIRSAFADSDDDDDEEEDSDANKSSVTIVLIDEVDILFDETPGGKGDVGFWSALGALAKATKSPIFLTANSCPPALDPDGSGSLAGGCFRLHLSPPSPIECASKLLQVGAREGLSIRPEWKAKGSEAVQQRLSTIATLCGRDLRKLMNELQVFAATATATATATTSANSGGIQPIGSASATTTGAAAAVERTQTTVWFPTVTALTPTKIPMDRHSVVTLKGTGFDTLLKPREAPPTDAIATTATSIAASTSTSTASTSTTGVAVRLGNRIVCPIHVVDDETLLVLCPPYHIADEERHCRTFCSRLTKRILPVSVSLSVQSGTSSSSRVGCSIGRFVTSETLVDGTRVYGTQRLTVEYALLEDLPLATIGDGDNPADETNGDDDDDDDTPMEDADARLCDNHKEPESQNDGATGAGHPELADGSNAKEEEARRETVDSNINFPTEDSERSQWKTAIAKAEAVSRAANVRSKPPRKTLPEDRETAAELDLLSKYAHDASDASFLEEFGEGLPYLSGACRGFGFDYTEDCILGRKSGNGGSDTLRMHENSRPPRAEKLFGLGWNESCYFHGDAETYVTLPSMSERKRANPHYFLNRFRGDEGAAGQLACSGMSQAAAAAAVSPDDLEEVFTHEDLDRLVHHRRQQELSSPGGASSEEDLYLDRGISPALLDLPDILRSAGAKALPPSSVRDDHRFAQSLDDSRNETRQRLLSRVTDYFLPRAWNDLAKCSYGRSLGLVENERDRTLTLLECLPALRHMACSEAASEFAELRATEAANATKRTSSRTRTRTRTRTRRTTTRMQMQARASRHHYFDKISVALRRDEADKNSSEVGALLAADRLVYSSSTNE